LCHFEARKIINFAEEKPLPNKTENISFSLRWEVGATNALAPQNESIKASRAIAHKK